ncbi:MAG: hypothetical protein A3F12_04190 [Gammaproteobacteria bacterium RIFCSPHIGHO2_12_FULL_38_14]|nr:MAG: hypothetical protein A3F12_04190 [Gammaproteobacteria bacterium RIFCSPHIGHO2_12_FULL_38_14]
MHSFDQTTSEFTALHGAAIYGNLHTVEELLNEDRVSFLQMLVTEDENKNLPLDRAAPRGHFQIVKILIEAHKSIDSKDYVMHNQQSYTPLLSTVRWYLKVLDGSYNKGTLSGIFNTRKNKDSEYLNIIRLLIQQYPEWINQCDNKGHNALYYVVHAVADAVYNENHLLLEKTKTVAAILMSNGCNFDDISNNKNSPHDLARIRRIDSIFLKIQEDIEKQKENERNQKILILPLKEKPTENLKNPPQNNTKTNKDCFIKKTHKNKRKTTNSNFSYYPLLNALESDNKNINPGKYFDENKNQVTPTVFKQKNNIDEKQVIDEVVKNFKFRKNYQNRSNNGKIKINEKIVRENLKEFIIKNDINNLINDDQHLIKKIADCLDIEEMTTGFLCCKKTTVLITFNDFMAQESLACNRKLERFGSRRK